MGNERKLRLIQVAKEFNVGINTITDFLHKKGIKSDGSPNTLVDAETYAVLEKEFGSNRAAASARNSIRERISLKQTTITLEEAKKQEREEEKEVVIKSNVISVKDEIPQMKILGKIDLSPKPKPAPAPAPQPAPAKTEAPAPKAEAPAPAQPEKSAPAAPAAPAQAAPAPAREEPKTAAPATPAATPAQPEAPEKTASASAPAAEAPKAEAPKEEAPKDNIFRPATVTLTGPQVLGTMDVSGFVPGGKHKRKRLQKEKVDVSKAQKGGSQGGGKQGQGGQGGNGGSRPGGGQDRNRGGQQNQPRPGEGRRNKNKNTPKPVVRPEVSDEEVSKQVKDTLARLTAKGAKTKAAKYRKEKREAVAERMSEEFERSEAGAFDAQGHRVRHRERAGHDDERPAHRSHHGLHEPRTDGVDQPASRCRGARGRGRGVRLQGRIRLRGDSGGHRRRPRGQGGGPRTASADRDGHGTRGPRQDLAAGQHPQDQRHRRRGRRHHAAYRRIQRRC